MDNPENLKKTELPGVRPDRYDSRIDSANGSAVYEAPSSAEGFSPQLGGHAKAGHANTTSFGSGPPDYTVPGHDSGKETAGQEEGGRPRQPSTSSAGRIIPPEKK